MGEASGPCGGREAGRVNPQHELIAVEALVGENLGVLDENCTAVESLHAHQNCTLLAPAAKSTIRCQRIVASSPGNLPTDVTGVTRNA